MNDEVKADQFLLHRSSFRVHIFSAISVCSVAKPSRGPLLPRPAALRYHARTPAIE
jgi:hypothetical protein